MNVMALFVGDVTADLTCVIDHVPGPDEKVHMESSIEDVGGVIANAAVACQLAGTHAVLACHIGNDSLGEKAISALQTKIHEVRTTVVEGSTTRVVILVESHGEKRLLLDPSNAFYPSEETLSSIELDGIQWLHTAIYGQSAFPLIERCRSAGIPWSLDLEPATFAQGLESIKDAVNGAEMIFCNDKAAALLGEDAVGILRNAGAKEVVRTQGSEGVCYYGSDVALRATSSSAISVTDTTGAGDCLAGWLIGERLSGASVEDQLRYAVAAASHSCQRYGAQTSYPQRREVDAASIEVKPL